MTTRRRILYLTTEDGKSCEIDVVPAVSNPASKRLPGIKDQETRLQNELVQLTDSTKERNKLLEQQLDEISTQATAWREQLRRESTEALTSSQRLQERCDIAVQEVLQSLDDYLHEKSNTILSQLVPQSNKQLDNMAGGISTFFHKQVPELVENQTGVVTRQLMKANETFDIEKQKDEKRETKLVEKANAHIQRTAQRLFDEHTVTSAKQMLLEESIVEEERAAARMLEIRMAKTVRSVAGLRNEIRAESIEREREDQVVLDTLLETQDKLQRAVVNHFGRQQVQQAQQAQQAQQIEHDLASSADATVPNENSGSFGS